jgi:hypothetical protein
MGEQKVQIGRNASPFPKGRAERRHSMQQMNKKLLDERATMIAAIRRLQEKNHALVYLFNDIATTVGISIPKTPVEGIDAVELLRGRIIALVALEKAAKEVGVGEEELKDIAGIEDRDDMEAEKEGRLP